jgi:hypothetical protein
MNCSPFDLKDYVFDELTAADRSQVDRHLAGCAGCREEMERLRLTQSALAALREEELPRRIAFVSDKVFEPAWWQSLWNSGPRLGFASALMLAASIFAHGLMYRPAAGPAQVQTASAIDRTAFEARVSEEVSRRMPAAMEQAVSRQNASLSKQIGDLEKRMSFERRADMLAFQEDVSYLKKRLDHTTIELARAEGGKVE